MDIAADLKAEYDRLDEMLAGLDDRAWATPSLAAGWTVCDVVLHLAQTEEMAADTVTAPVDERTRANESRGVDDAAERAVTSERAAPDEVFERWRRASAAFVSGLAASDPDRLVQWVGGTLKPATLATTRLAEHWAHGLDIAGGLGIEFPDTARLRHIAWLAHRSLPYALALGGRPPAEVYCGLTAPDGTTVWRLGPDGAESA